MWIIKRADLVLIGSHYQTEIKRFFSGYEEDGVVSFGGTKSGYSNPGLAYPPD
jgi:hypothetical protein